jgi:diguanylate cyclase (GGDEF)-like protein
MQGTFQYWLAYLPLLAILVAPTAIATWFAIQLHRERVLRRRDGADYLTGLPTRRAAAAVAAQAIVEAKNSGNEFAVIVLNVDRLKPLNDSLGHQAGDELLLALSQRLQGVLGYNNVLARLAGDEFTIIARDLKGPREAETLVNKITEAVREPFVIASFDIHTSLTMGVSMYPLDGETFDVLLRRAEMALRSAKAATRGSYRFYALEMSNAADERVALENDLRRAIELGQLELHYQPKVDIGTNRIRSAEALLRWRHPTRGLVPPNAFIPIAEDTGLIVQIGEWVLRESCRQVRAWIDSGMSPVRVAVNLSAKQFRHVDLVAVVRSALDEAQLQPGYLELELTESAIMDDAEKSASTLEFLSTMGVHISIDDFGTEYSSMNHLKQLPVDKIKIPMPFVQGIDVSEKDEAITKSIIVLAKSLGLSVLAEGVETKEQYDFLTCRMCDEVQGFFYYKPMPAEEMELLLRKQV